MWGGILGMVIGFTTWPMGYGLWACVEWTWDIFFATVGDLQEKWEMFLACLTRCFAFLWGKFNDGTWPYQDHSCTFFLLDDMMMQFSWGEGIKKDELSAAQFLLQAAQVGETKAMYNLGLMYLGWILGKGPGMYLGVAKTRPEPRDKRDLHGMSGFMGYINWIWFKWLKVAYRETWWTSGVEMPKSASFRKFLPLQMPSFPKVLGLLEPT